VQQLADNKRAAADRAAAGSLVHGAPMATPGPDPYGEAAKAAKRAEDYSGVTDLEAREGQAEFVADALQAGVEAADDRAAASADERETARGKTKAAAKATSRTAAEAKPTETR
jgi:hypothetical protein